MTDFEGSRTANCRECGRPYNTAEGPQCDCGQGEEEEEEGESK